MRMLLMVLILEHPMARNFGFFLFRCGDFHVKDVKARLSKMLTK